MDKWVLVCLADHATPEGTRVCPSVATLVEQSGIPERTVRRILDRLEREHHAIIPEMDPDVIALVRKTIPANRLPRIYRLTFIRGVTVAPQSVDKSSRPGVPNRPVRGATGVPSPGTQTVTRTSFGSKPGTRSVDRGQRRGRGLRSIGDALREAAGT